MQDYIVFFDGYESEIKQFEDNLDIVQVLSKPAVMSNFTANQNPPPTKYHDLSVMIFLAKDNRRYNIAFQVLPDNDSIEKSIAMYRPTPVPSR